MTPLSLRVASMQLNFFRYVLYICALEKIDYFIYMKGFA